MDWWRDVAMGVESVVGVQGERCGAEGGGAGEGWGVGRSGCGCSRVGLFLALDAVGLLCVHGWTLDDVDGGKLMKLVR